MNIIEKQYPNNKKLSGMIDYINDIIKNLEVKVELTGAGVYIVVPKYRSKSRYKNILQCEQHKDGKIIVTIKACGRKNDRIYHKDSSDNSYWTFDSILALKERDIESYIIDTYNLLSEKSYYRNSFKVDDEKAEIIKK